MAGLVGLIAIGYVAIRWQLAAHGDLSRFILIGRDRTASPGPRGVYVASGGGYDGQYYYRLALSPWHLGGVVNGIPLDAGLRRQRILYPALAWLLSGGSAQAVPAALVVVNVVAVAAVAGLGARLAQVYGQHAAWGFAFAGFAGFVSSLGRDLTELTSAALIIAALLALSRSRTLLAAVALGLGVLARETVLAVVVGVAVGRLWAMARGRARPGVADLPWAGPVIVYVTWQLVVAGRYGSAPLRQETGNGGIPGVAAARALAHAVAHPNLTNLIFLGGVVSLVLLVGLAFAGARSSRPPAFLWVSLGLLAALAVSLSKDVWNHDPHELRTFGEIHLLGVAALLYGHRTRALATYLALAVPTFVALAVYTTYTI